MENSNQAQESPQLTTISSDDMTFREAMSELNGIVEALESNTLELEESLVKYERGIALLRFLKESLNTAQQKVEAVSYTHLYANARPYQITIFADGAPIGTTTLIDSYSSLQVVTFEEPIYANTITVRIDSVYEGSRYSDCGISEIGFR